MILTICLLSLFACARSLTPNEVALSNSIMGASIDTDRVRLVRGAPVAAVTFRRKARPRVTCRERILPPVKDAIVTAKPAAVTIFNTVFFARDWYTDDYARGYPETLNLSAAMLLAHELLHVWQWQNRVVTGYSPLRAASEHNASPDPYLFELSGAPDFLSFGFEQQGAIVEEYVCCRALDPDAQRTQRLHDMLAAYLPVTPLPPGGQRESDVLLPWRGAQTRGICSQGV
ncbi:MAG: hypothetical protein AB3N11_16275 [Arenibacterium sp.]